MLLYALLYLTGNSEMTLEELKHFRQLDSRTPGHPENCITDSVETTTGPLGQGVASSVGTALAERLLAAEFGDIVDHHTYVLCSDGDLMEGVSHEAIALAGHLKLSKLIFLYDDNGISIDGPLTLTDNVDQVARFQAHGWNSFRIDGHDHKAIADAIRKAQASDRPTMIACKTTIGFGAPTRAGTSKAHGEPLGAEELAGAKKALGWDYGPFEIPDDVLSAWRAVGSKGAKAHADWQAKFEKLDKELRAEFQRRVIDRKRPAALDGAIRKLKDKLVAEPQTIATRKASELALEAIVEVVPEMLLGSADLTPSNNTRTKHAKDVTPDDFSGPLYPLRHPRNGHGGGDERHRAAWRLRAGRRHLHVLRRLCPPVDADRGAVAHPGGLHHDPRFDRARRRRPDPSAGRAPRLAAGDAEHARVPSGRSGRDRRMLAARAGEHQGPDRAGAVAAEPDAGAHHAIRRQPLRPWAPMS